MQNAWVLNQEIPINPELYHPCVHHRQDDQKQQYDKILILNGKLLNIYKCIPFCKNFKHDMHSDN